ncbi:hypothetical protein BD560DRAFT_107736 [Blakeslea trispora]|nr:hypothetical protein BD560DRAFT_107736 [Blakeslea trispora]
MLVGTFISSHCLNDKPNEAKCNKKHSSLSIQSLCVCQYKLPVLFSLSLSFLLALISCSTRSYFASRYISTVIVLVIIVGTDNDEFRTHPQ